MNKKVLIPIANGTEELEAVAIIDTLRRSGAEVVVASIQEKIITGSCKTKIIADKLISECKEEDWDLIVLPGGLPGSEYLRDSKELTTLLKKQAASGKLYAAICAAPVIVLQHHGLLEGKKATVNPALADKMKNKAHLKERVVVDDNCITSQSRGTALEFAVKLIELLIDKDKADEIAEKMLLLQS
ncbi:MAG: DJ-1/PfpI family protein [Candidatus Cloacimonetes bacterium]|nr:DJ-1/PfpI family protein [Candidatus Cloacimonadota bacterium]MCF7813864.1 DJ-1/PfpI family protein [Candidatus Cloacimonadota bacterium]MCF7869456.1 DJ-1/PfpI family protein [Candidatus Cloacimonadota bacterium]MCF7883976.1 DJ-1/PfpI family protein [Candidatus Cloacimonadota bacterium]